MTFKTNDREGGSPMQSAVHPRIGVALALAALSQQVPHRSGTPEAARPWWEAWDGTPAPYRAVNSYNEKVGKMPGSLCR